MTASSRAILPLRVPHPARVLAELGPRWPRGSWTMILHVLAAFPLLSPSPTLLSEGHPQISTCPPICSWGAPPAAGSCEPCPGHMVSTPERPAGTQERLPPSMSPRPRLTEPGLSRERLDQSSARTACADLSGCGVWRGRCGCLSFPGGPRSWGSCHDAGTEAQEGEVTCPRSCGGMAMRS